MFTLRLPLISTSNDEKRSGGLRGGGGESPIINCPHSTDCTQERSCSLCAGLGEELELFQHSRDRFSPLRQTNGDSETFPAFRRISFSRKCRLVRRSGGPREGDGSRRGHNDVATVPLEHGNERVAAAAAAAAVFSGGRPRSHCTLSYLQGEMKSRNIVGAIGDGILLETSSQSYLHTLFGSGRHRSSDRRGESPPTVTEEADDGLREGERPKPKPPPSPPPPPAGRPACSAARRRRTRGGRGGGGPRRPSGRLAAARSNISGTTAVRKVHGLLHCTACSSLLPLPLPLPLPPSPLARSLQTRQGRERPRARSPDDSSSHRPTQLPCSPCASE